MAENTPMVGLLPYDPLSPGPRAPVVYGYQAVVASGTTVVLTFEVPMNRVNVGTIGNNALVLEAFDTQPQMEGNRTLYVQGTESLLLAFGPGVLILGFTVRNPEPGPIDVRINAIQEGRG